MAAAIAFSAACASAASATATLTPASAQFGAYQIGSSSAPKDYTFTVTAGDPFHVDIQITNPDWSQTNNCPTPTMGMSTTQSCTIKVTFKPIAYGSRGGLLSTGTHITAPGPPIGDNRGPTAEAFGTGMFPGGATTLPNAPAVGTPVAPSTPAAKKKCKRKRHHKASSAKRKCKKKKTRK